MRITFVCPLADLTGGFRVIATYAENLRLRGHEVLVVSRPRPKPTLRDIARALYRRRRLPSNPRPEATHLDGRDVPHRVLERRRPVVAADLPDADVVVATWWETVEWVAALPPEKGVQVHLMQDYEVWTGEVERVDATCRLPMPKIVTARWVGELLVERFGQTAIAIVPNAVDTETFAAPPRGMRPTPSVGFTYSSMPAKGCDVAAEAIRLARLRLGDLEVVAFGSGAPTADVPLPLQVEFHLRVADAKLSELYSRCDAWLFPTRKEGFGLPLLEAMACRTPVIATPAGAAPALLAGGGGRLIANEDPQAMADAIVAICSLADDEWRRLSDAAYATAHGYAWAQATDAFESALRTAMSNAGEEVLLPPGSPSPTGRGLG